MRVLLIDADLILYRIASVMETEIDWGDGLWTLHSSSDTAIEQFLFTVGTAVEQLKPTEVTLCWSDNENYRKNIAPYYKSHRQGKRKPLAYKPAKAFLQEETEYRCSFLPQLEADDVLGIFSTNPNSLAENIIWTLDKDLKQIPLARLYDGEELADPTHPEEAELWFFKQALIGDASDGYKGCPKIGEKTADKLLRPHIGNHDELLEATIGAFRKAKLGEDYAREQLQLARILHFEEYDFATKQPILKYLQ